MSICNTPGSGKTRLIFEGVCCYWGLYFTAKIGPERIGSSYLEKFLEELEQQKRLVTITEENHSSVLNANREVTSRQFLLVLYVRLLVLRVFLDCASAMPSGITEEHKNRWLLLQVAPGLLPAAPDIFHALNLRFRQASLSDLESSVRAELQKIRHHIGQPLFCVLDEAQIPTNTSLSCFRSDVNQEAPRSLLRQIVFTWKLIYIVPDPPLLRRITGFVFDYFFHCKPRDIGRPSYEKLVEYGVARFGDHRNILADEPLALLAAVQYFKTKKDWDLQHFLLEGISHSSKSTTAVDVQSLTSDTLEQQNLISLEEMVQAAAIQAAQRRQRRRQLGAEANIPSAKETFKWE